VNATPTFFIGHQALAGAPDVEAFSRLINQELAAQGVALSTAFPPPTVSVSPAMSAPTQAKHLAIHATTSRKTAPAKATAETTPSAFGLFGSIPGGGLSSFSAGAATCSEAEAAEQQPVLINTTQLRQLLAGGTKPLFVDVRPPEEVAKTRIPGAVNIPAGEMPQRWNTLPKNRVIVFYESGQTSGGVCAFGRAAGRILLKHGYPFSQVKVYQDGLAGWEKSGLGTTP
jgi:rhodanese-related sulfurtransferase